MIGGGTKLVRGGKLTTWMMLWLLTVWGAVENEDGAVEWEKKCVVHIIVMDSPKNVITLRQFSESLLEGMSLSSRRNINNGTCDLKMCPPPPNGNK